MAVDALGRPIEDNTVFPVEPDFAPALGPAQPEPRLMPEPVAPVLPPQSNPQIAPAPAYPPRREQIRELIPTGLTDALGQPILGVMREQNPEPSVVQPATVPTGIRGPDGTQLMGTGPQPQSQFAQPAQPATNEPTGAPAPFGQFQTEPTRPVPPVAVEGQPTPQGDPTVIPGATRTNKQVAELMRDGGKPSDEEYSRLYASTDEADILRRRGLNPDSDNFVDRREVFTHLTVKSSLASMGIRTDADETRLLEDPGERRALREQVVTLATEGGRMQVTEKLAEIEQSRDARLAETAARFEQDRTQLREQLQRAKTDRREGRLDRQLDALSVRDSEAAQRRGEEQRLKDAATYFDVDRSGNVRQRTAPGFQPTPARDARREESGARFADRLIERENTATDRELDQRGAAVLKELTAANVKEVREITTRATGDLRAARAAGEADNKRYGREAGIAFDKYISRLRGDYVDADEVEDDLRENSAAPPAAPGKKKEAGRGFGRFFGDIAVAGGAGLAQGGVGLWRLVGVGLSTLGNDVVLDAANGVSDFVTETEKALSTQRTADTSAALSAAFQKGTWSEVIKDTTSVLYQDPTLLALTVAKSLGVVFGAAGPAAALGKIGGTGAALAAQRDAVVGLMAKKVGQGSADYAGRAITMLPVTGSIAANSGQDAADAVRSLATQPGGLESIRAMGAFKEFRQQHQTKTDAEIIEMVARRTGNTATGVGLLGGIALSGLGSAIDAIALGKGSAVRAGQGMARRVATTAGTEVVQEIGENTATETGARIGQGQGAVDSLGQAITNPQRAGEGLLAGAAGGLFGVKKGEGGRGFAPLLDAERVTPTAPTTPPSDPLLALPAPPLVTPSPGQAQRAQAQTAVDALGNQLALPAPYFPDAPPALLPAPGRSTTEGTPVTGFGALDEGTVAAISRKGFEIEAAKPDYTPQDLADLMRLEVPRAEAAGTNVSEAIRQATSEVITTPVLSYITDAHTEVNSWLASYVEVGTSAAARRQAAETGQPAPRPTIIASSQEFALGVNTEGVLTYYEPGKTPQPVSTPEGEFNPKLPAAAEARIDMTSQVVKFMRGETDQIITDRAEAVAARQAAQDGAFDALGQSRTADPSAGLRAVDDAIDAQTERERTEFGLLAPASAAQVTGELADLGTFLSEIRSQDTATSAETATEVEALVRPLYRREQNLINLGSSARGRLDVQLGEVAAGLSPGGQVRAAVEELAERIRLNNAVTNAAIRTAAVQSKVDELDRVRTTADGILDPRAAAANQAVAAATEVVKAYVDAPLASLDTPALAARLSSLPVLPGRKSGTVSVPEGVNAENRSIYESAATELATNLVAQRLTVDPELSVRAAYDLAARTSSNQDATSIIQRAKELARVGDLDAMNAAITSAQETIDSFSKITPPADKPKAGTKRRRSQGPVLKDPISLADLTKVAAEAQARLKNLGIEFRAYADIESIPDVIKGASRDFKALVLSDSENSGRPMVVLVANRIADAADAQAQIRHEAIGHFGLDFVLGKNGVDRLRGLVLGAATRPGKIRDLAADVKKRYATGKLTPPGNATLADEIIAAIAENRMVERAPVGPITRVIDGIRAILNMIGWGDKRTVIGVDEVQTILAAVNSYAEGRILSATARGLAQTSAVTQDIAETRQTIRVSPRPTFFETTALQKFAGLLNDNQAVVQLLDFAAQKGVPLPVVESARRGLLAISSSAKNIYDNQYGQQVKAAAQQMHVEAARLGVSETVFEFNLNKWMALNHSLERNHWFTLTQGSPADKKDTFRRNQLLTQFHAGQITRAEFEGRVAPMFTDLEHNDALYAGSDATPEVARIQLAVIESNSDAVQSYKRVHDGYIKPLTEKMRAAEIAIGMDPLRMTDLYGFKFYVPLRGMDVKQQSALSQAREVSTLGEDVAASTGRGDQLMSEGQFRQIVAMAINTGKRTAEAEFLTPFSKVLEAIAQTDPDQVRIVPRDQKMISGETTLASVKDLGNYTSVGDQIESAGRNDVFKWFDQSSGTYKAIMIHAPDIAQAFQTSLNSQTENALMSNSRFITRTISSGYTTYSPDFLLRSGIRDSATMLATAISKFGAKVGRDAAINLMAYAGAKGGAVGRAVWAYYGQDAAGRAAFMEQTFAPGSESAKMQGYINSGAAQNFGDSTYTLANQSRDLGDSAIARLQEAGRAEILQKTGNALEKYRSLGDFLDNVPRYALYRALIDNGINPDRATIEARELMNFQQSNSIGKWLGAFFVFANPSAVDMWTNLHKRIWKNATPPIDYVKDIDGRVQAQMRGDWWNSLDKGYLGFMAAAGVANAALLGAVYGVALGGGDGDDELSPLANIRPETLMMNYVIPGGDGSVLTVPIPYGVDMAMHATGKLLYMAAAGTHNQRDLLRAYSNVLSKAFSLGPSVQLFEDQGIGYTLLRAATPTLAQPITSLATQTNELGQDLRVSDFNKQRTDPKPGYTLARSSTPDEYTNISRDMYRIAGIDMTPEQVRETLLTVSGYVPVLSYAARTADKIARDAKRAGLDEQLGELGGTGSAPTPLGRAMGILGGPVGVQDVRYNASRDRAELEREYIGPAAKLRNDAFKKDQEEGFRSKTERVTDQLDTKKMGPNEKAFFEANPWFGRAKEIERQFRQKEDALGRPQATVLRQQLNDALARGETEQADRLRASIRQVDARQAQAYRQALRPTYDLPNAPADGDFLSQ